MNVLVTGGGGFIGSFLTGLLVGRGDGSDQLLSGSDLCLGEQIVRVPARVTTDRAAELERPQEAVLEERRGPVVQRVPIGGRHL